MIRVDRVIVIGGFGEQGRRGAPSIIKKGMRGMAKMWHAKFMPMHFRQGAADRYAYQERKPKYAAWKSRRRLPPLVATGMTRTLAMGIYRVSGGSKRVTGTFALPWYVRMKSMGGKPAIGRELTEIRTGEIRKLVKVLARRVTGGLNALKGRKVIKP
jgi:hypothetical protein